MALRKGAKTQKAQIAEFLKYCDGLEKRLAAPCLAEEMFKRLHAPAAVEDLKRQLADITQLREENERLREALEWYREKAVAFRRYQIVSLPKTKR